VIVFAQESDYKSRDRKRVAQAAGLAFEMLYMPGQTRCAQDRVETVRQAVVHNGRGNYDPSLQDGGTISCEHN
jgi:hypothetical protein